MTNRNNQLFHYVIRLSKEDSAFFYFQLEANDGVCFYSTLEHPHHAQYRDIELRGDIKLLDEMKQILNQCAQKFKIEYLVDEIVLDMEKK